MTIELPSSISFCCSHHHHRYDDHHYDHCVNRISKFNAQAAPLKISQLNEAAIKAVSDGDPQLISLQKSNDFVCLAIR